VGKIAASPSQTNTSPGCRTGFWLGSRSALEHRHGDTGRGDEGVARAACRRRLLGRFAGLANELTCQITLVAPARSKVPSCHASRNHPGHAIRGTF
jgi:hypothetical protein